MTLRLCAFALIPMRLFEAIFEANNRAVAGDTHVGWHFWRPRRNLTAGL